MSNTPDTPDAAACGVCSAPTGDTARLCRTHTDELRTRLAGVEALVTELDVTITRQARATANLDGGKSPETPLMWNENASTKAFELNATLNGWALDTSKLAEDERDQLAHVHHSDTAGLAQWLTRNLSTLRQHADAGQAFGEIADSVREAFRAIDRTPDPIPFGPCGHIYEDGTICQATLYGNLERPTVPCRDCGATHSTAERLAWMLQHARGQLPTIPELAAVAECDGQ